MGAHIRALILVLIYIKYLIYFFNIIKCILHLQNNIIMYNNYLNI